MKPETPTPQLSPEQAPAKYLPSVELTPGLTSPESGLNSGPERNEQKADMTAIMADVNLTTILPAPVIDKFSVADNTTLGISPLTANDDDLIEKEWVDKAKKIVTDTQNDPHQREKEVSRLQVDYIKKRFGRELGVAE